MRTPLLLIAAGALAVFAGACHHAAPSVAVQPRVDSTALAERTRQDSITRAQDEARAQEAAERRAAQRHADSLAALERRSTDLKERLAVMLHFDFDKATIRQADAALLDQKIPILLSNPQVHIEIAGNCDERGSAEYNLALGNRRAIAARAYLVAHGIAAGRIETVSYGEERPLDSGHTQEAWAKNRNDQFDILTANVVLR